MVAKIAVIGAGWWSQGWHIPCLDRNPNVKLVAVVDKSEHPTSGIEPNLISLSLIRNQYNNTQIFHSVQDMLQQVGDELDGVIICTPHATHCHIGQEIYTYNDTHRLLSQPKRRPIHILMEKPMATDIDHAKALCSLVQSHPDTEFWVNHSANFREQAKIAQKAVSTNQVIGRIRHITCSFASPLLWLFQNPENVAWNKPSGTMLGNGFAWGQSCHLLGWIYFVCGDLVRPSKVFCAMTHDETTGADMSHSATVLCDDDIVMNVSGTTWLPGSHDIGKQVQIQIYGSQGAILYEGDDSNPRSGRLELRNEDGSVHYLTDDFAFENLSTSGYGAESVVNFVRMCAAADKDDDDDSPPPMNCANVFVGLRTVQTLEAMYRSHASKGMVDVCLK